MKLSSNPKWTCRIVFFALILSFMFTVSNAQQASYGDLQKADETRRHQFQEDAKNTIALINHINYLYVMLSTYNNICVLQDEYDKLSLKKIDPTKIPNHTLEQKVEGALQTLEGLKMQEEEYAFYKEMLENDKMAERRKLFFTVLMAAPDAIKEGSSSGGKAAENGNGLIGISAAFIAGTGKTLLKDTFGSVVDYQKRLAELRRRNKEYKFEYDKKKFQKLADYNREMLAAEVDLAREFGLQTNDIVNGEEVIELIDCIKGNDRKTIFYNLRMDQNKKHFATFPMFWFYLATTAVEYGEYDEAIAAAEKFEKVNSGFIKTDVTCAYVAIAKITAMIVSEKKKTKREMAEIRRNLETIQYVNMNDRYPDWSYLCASIYYDILKDPNEAKKILTTLIANLEGRYKNRLEKYRDLYSKKELSVEDNPIPIETNLLRARVLYKDILKNANSPTLVDELVYMCSKNTIASTEKLYYVGDVRVSDLWKVAEKDVLDINLYYQTNTFSKNEIVIDVPVNWFLLGDVEANVTLWRDDQEVATLKELKSKRTIRKNPNGIEQSLVRLRYKCPKSMLRGMDAIVLNFPHESWPVKITYMPGDGYSLQEAEYKDDNTPFIPTKIEFMGKNVRDLKMPDSVPPLSNMASGIGVNLDQFKRKEDLRQTESFGIPLWVAHRLYAFKEASEGTHYMAVFRNGFTNLINKYAETDYFIPQIEITDDLEIHVLYANKTSEQGKMDIEVSFYTEYGAQICKMNGAVDLAPESQDVLTFKWPDELKGIKAPKYVLVQYLVSKGVWDKYKNWRNQK